MRWYLNPLNIYRAVRDVRKIAGAGGPEALRLTGIGKPRGLLVPHSSVSFEVVAKDGTRTSYSPEFPVPHATAWSYRLARKLGVPLVSDLDPEEIEVEVGGRGPGS